MSTWVGVGWGVVFGAAMLMVTFNVQDSAWRIHGYMANKIGANRLFTPNLVRITCGLLCAVSTADVAVSLAQAA